MADPNLDSEPQTEAFSWESWLAQGFKAFRRTLFRHDLGLPEEFWYHLERAAHEMLMAGRILLRTIRDMRRQRDAPPSESRGPIDIDWD
ncbi:MAG: hypothetical protein GY759_10810 [Chloroflexi bacterium]|nr:hypothetical protein [Chloroflexota bacterium]